MGSSQSQLGPGIVRAASCAPWPPFWLVPLYRREAFEGWRRRRRRARSRLDVFPLLFREGVFGMRLRPTRTQAQLGAIMMKVGGLS